MNISRLWILRLRYSWEITPWNLVDGYQDFKGTLCIFFRENRDSRFLRSSFTYLPNYTALHPSKFNFGIFYFTGAFCATSRVYNFIFLLPISKLPYSHKLNINLCILIIILIIILIRDNYLDSYSEGTQFEFRPDIGNPDWDLSCFFLSHSSQMQL
jgi:hypothetical protein